MSNQYYNRGKEDQESPSQGVTIQRSDSPKIWKFLQGLTFGKKKYSTTKEISNDLENITEIIKNLNNKNPSLETKDISLIEDMFSEIVETLEEYIKKVEASGKSNSSSKAKEGELTQQLEQANQAKETLIQAKKTLINKITTIKSQLDDSQNQVTVLKQQVLNVTEDRAKLMSIAGKKLRDKTKTADLSSEKLRNDEIVQEYKLQKSQNFYPVSNSIFNFLAEIDSSLTNNRKQENSKIKSILSQKILFEGLKLFRSDEDNEILGQATEKVIQALSDCEGVNSTELSVSSNPEVKELVKKILQCMQNEDDTKAPLDSEGNVKQEIILEVREGIYSTLQETFNQSSLDFSNIDKEVDELINKGLRLVQNIMIADPPGRLEIYDQGTPFDREKHEDIFGEDEGSIELTIFPAYFVEDKVYDRASVMITQKQ
jgi:hypothetical protein